MRSLRKENAAFSEGYLVSKTGNRNAFLAAVVKELKTQLLNSCLRWITDAMTDIASMLATTTGETMLSDSPRRHSPRRQIFADGLQGKSDFRNILTDRQRLCCSPSRLR